MCSETGIIRNRKQAKELIYALTQPTSDGVTSSFQLTSAKPEVLSV